MGNKTFEVANEESLLGTQLQIGKEILVSLLELHGNENINGVVIPTSVNGMDFNITIEKADESDDK
ncbi:TPA: hypothetical protein ACGOY6_001314 [Streptococcus suis]